MLTKSGQGRKVFLPSQKSLSRVLAEQQAEVLHRAA
jgi:hypothetical protein